MRRIFVNKSVFTLSTFYFVQIKILVVVEFRIKVFKSSSVVFLSHEEIETAQFIHILYVYLFLIQAN